MQPVSIHTLDWLQKQPVARNMLLRIICPAQSCCFQIESCLKHINTSDLVNDYSGIGNWAPISDRSIRIHHYCDNNDVLIYHKSSLIHCDPSSEYLKTLRCRSFNLSIDMANLQKLEALNCSFNEITMKGTNKRSQRDSYEDQETEPSYTDKKFRMDFSFN